MSEVKFEVTKKHTKATRKVENKVLKNIFINLYNDYKARGKGFYGIWENLANEAQKNNIKLKYNTTKMRIQIISETDKEVSTILNDIGSIRLTDKQMNKQNLLLKSLLVNIYQRYKRQEEQTGEINFAGIWKNLTNEARKNGIYIELETIKSRVIKISETDKEAKLILNDINGIRLSSEQIDTLKNIFNDLYKKYKCRKGDFFGFWEELSNKIRESGIIINGAKIKNIMAIIFVDEQKMRQKFNKINDFIKEFEQEKMRVISKEFFRLITANKEKYKCLGVDVICEDLSNVLLKKNIIIDKDVLLEKLVTSKNTQEILVYINKCAVEMNNFIMQTYIDKYNELKESKTNFTANDICEKVLPIINEKIPTIILKDIYEKIDELYKDSDMFKEYYNDNTDSCSTIIIKHTNGKMSRLDDEILKDFFINLYNKYKNKEKQTKNKDFRGIWDDLAKIFVLFRKPVNNNNIDSKVVRNRIKNLSENDKKLKTMLDDIENTSTLSKDDNNVYIAEQENMDSKQIAIYKKLLTELNKQLNLDLNNTNNM